MRRSVAALFAVDVQCAARQVNLFPTQLHELAHAQAVTVGDQDQRSIPYTMAPSLACCSDETLHLSWGEVLAAATHEVCYPARRRDFPIFDARRAALGALECQYGAHREVSFFPIKRRFWECWDYLIGR